MNRKIKRRIRKVKELFDTKLINELARKSKFVQRKGKLDALAFLKLCALGDDSLCKESLSKLCTTHRKHDRRMMSAKRNNQLMEDLRAVQK